MDIKEPSVHRSHRSASNRSRSARSVTVTVTTIDSIPQKYLNDPESKVMNRINIPFFVTQFLQELGNMFLLLIIFTYGDHISVSQFSLAYPITYFFNTAVPKAIAHAQVDIFITLISENKIKQVDEYLAYHFLVQFAWFVVSLVFAFIVGVTLREQLGLTDEQDCQIVIYVPVMMSIGTFLNIFNHAPEVLCQFEGRNFLNVARSALTLFTTLLATQLCYQFSSVNKIKQTLTQHCIGQIIGLLPASIIVFAYYQDFKQFGFQGVLKMKFKNFKQFQFSYVKTIIIKVVPKIFQFGSPALLMFSCNIAISITFTNSQDIMIARIGLLYYCQAFQLFGFFASSYQNMASIVIPINILGKKYIRSKTFMIKGFVYGIVFQAISLIIGLIIGPSIVEFFMPQLHIDDKEIIILYGENYIKYGYVLPIITIPLHFAQAVMSLENNFKITMMVTLIHPVIGIITLLILQFSVGNKAEFYQVQFYADIFSGIAGAVIYLKKLLEIMALAKIETRRLKKKKKMGDDDDLLDKKD